jgi:hypothetical protein
MQELLDLLKDGKSRSIAMIAKELNKSVDQVERDLEFLEKNKVIRRIEFSACTSCSSCSPGDNKKTCPGCMPDGGFKNMGVMWEII